MGAHFPSNGSAPAPSERIESKLLAPTDPLERLRALKTLGLRGKLQANVREFWRSGRAFEEGGQSAFLNAYGNLLSPSDHEARFHTLLGQTAGTGALPNAALAEQASQMRTLINPELDKVRIAWATGNEADWEQVAPFYKTHAALLIPRAWAMQASNPQRASALFSAIDPRTRAPAEEWRLRRILVRNAIRGQSYGEAYDLAASHGLSFEGATRTDAHIAELMAGWIALTYASLPELALEHYRRVTDQQTGPWIGSKAWRGRARALKMAGQELAANQALRTCAAYQTTLYAFLCLEDLNTPLKVASTRHAEQDPRFAELLAITRSLIAADRPERDILPFVRSAFEVAARPQDQAALGALLQNRTDLAFTHTMGVLETRGTAAFSFKAMRTLNPAWQIPKTLDPAILQAIIAQESQFRPSVASPAGATGLMQLMPATAKAMAEELDLAWTPSLLTDPSQNMALGAHYYRKLLNRYDGAHLLALSAYNAGPSRTQAWLKDFGDPRTGIIAAEDWIDALTIGETRLYVQRVLTNILLYRAAERPRGIDISLPQLMTGL